MEYLQPAPVMLQIYMWLALVPIHSHPWKLRWEVSEKAIYIPLFGIRDATPYKVVRGLLVFPWLSVVIFAPLLFSQFILTPSPLNDTCTTLDCAKTRNAGQDLQPAPEPNLAGYKFRFKNPQITHLDPNLHKMLVLAYIIRLIHLN